MFVTTLALCRHDFHAYSYRSVIVCINMLLIMCSHDCSAWERGRCRISTRPERKDTSLQQSLAMTGLRRLVPAAAAELQYALAGLAQRWLIFVQWLI